MAKFRLSFGLGVAVCGGILLFLSMATAWPEDLMWRTVFTIMLCGWTEILLYAALAYGVERLVKSKRKDDSFRIPPVGKWLVSLPFFDASSAAAVYFIEMLCFFQCVICHYFN